MGSLLEGLPERFRLAENLWIRTLGSPGGRGCLGKGWAFTNRGMPMLGDRLVFVFFAASPENQFCQLANRPLSQRLHRKNRQRGSKFFDPESRLSGGSQLPPLGTLVVTLSQIRNNFKPFQPLGEKEFSLKFPKGAGNLSNRRKTYPRNF